MQDVKEHTGIQGTVIVRSHPFGAIEKFMISLLTEGEIESMGLARAEEQEEFSAWFWMQQNVRDEKRRKQVADFIKTGKIEVTQKNMVVWSLNNGFDILVQFLISAYTGSFAFASTLGIAWGEIGTGNTAPMNTDVALTTPTNRAPVSYAADAGFNEAQVQFFFPDAALANGTYTEFGTFIGGSASLGSGNMFNHALFGTPYSKSSGVDTTVECDFSFSN